MSFSMFPSGPSRDGPKPAVEIKAGKCEMELQQGTENSYIIAPILKKGSLCLVKVDEIMHFQWKDRSSGHVIDDFMVFPGDAVLSKVNTGREKDRVYLLKWQGGVNRKFMFWMQDKSADQDDQNCKKFNEYITNPSREAAAGGRASANDFMNMLGQARNAPAANRPPAAPTGNIGGFDFSQLLSGMSSMPPRPPAAATESTPSAALAAQDFQNAMMGGAYNAPDRTDLSEVLRPDQVIGSNILSDPEAVADMIPHLPEGQQTAAHLEQAIRSPQFQQAVGELGNAIEQDPSRAVISNVGLPVPADGVDLRDPVNSFLDAVQNNSSIASTSDTSGTNVGFTTPARQQDGNNAEENEDNKMDESA